MEDRDQTIGVRLTLKERQALDEQANKANLSLTDYVRARLFSEKNDSPNPREDRLEGLIKHAIYQLERVHVTIYSIAAAEGTTQGFLSTETLKEIYKTVRVQAIHFAADLPEAVSKVRADVAAAAAKQA